MQPSQHRKPRPPAKKRHTKPCRFFQHAGCPLTANECDFAHVLSNNVPPYSPSPCRYYAAGRCGSGSTCRFKHATQFPEDSDDIQNDTISPGDDINSDFSPDSPTAQRPAPEAMGYSPPIGHWGNPYIGPVGSPVFSPGFVPPHIYYSDLYGRDTGRTLSNSNSTSSSLSDDVLFVTEDPNYSEHYHQYQSRVRIMDEQPLVHVSPFYPTPPGPVVPLTLDMAYVASPNVYRTYGYVQPISPATKSKTRSRTDIRHKAVNYKTKPCRFYKVDGTCPNGSRCTFIHSDASPQESPISTQPERLLPVPPPATLPPKPITAIEESKKKNFFPISWRVIGGGVLMGSESKPSAEPGTLNFVDGGMDEAPFGENESDEKASPPKPNKRTRSSSIPPAPKTSHVDTGALFSAESNL